jgi:hypothetical protein
VKFEPIFKVYVKAESMPDENKINEPLGLPRGSIRAILAGTVVGGTIVLYGITGNVPDWLISAFGTAFGFYFGSRSVSK